MSVRLPIFPLGTVLVPGLVLPLHVVEPRYRLLVDALMALPEGATRQFGVVAVRAGQPLSPERFEASDLHAMGCTAELREVTPYADGRFDVVTVGESRFRLEGLDEDAGTPYPTGLVEFVPEVPGRGDLQTLTSQVIRHFADYRERLGVDVTELPEDPQVVSYLVAAAVVMEVGRRQELLEAPTTAERLRAEAALLRQEKQLLRAFRALPATELSRTEMSRN